MNSLFQTASGAAHWPSILMVLGWLIGSLVTGGFMYANLRVNRSDRVKEYNIRQARDIELANAVRDTAQANALAASANATAESERLERIKLEARVAPRSLTIDQQRAIRAFLDKKFIGQTVVLTSYGLDGEGGSVAAQIKSVLESVAIIVDDTGSLPIVSGGFYMGIHIRGPQNDLLSGLNEALASIGKLRVIVNGPVLKTGASIKGNAAIVGNASIGGGGGTENIAIPTSGPVSITIGVKPITIAVAK